MSKRKLTAEQKHKFKEDRVRQILIYAFPDKYSGAELTESPDIIVRDLSIGGEVTDGTLQKIHEKMSYISGITAGKIDPKGKKFKKHDNGDIIISTLPDGKPIASLVMWGDKHDLLAAYLKKVKKLNQTHYIIYIIFEENNLFITAWMMDDDDLVNSICRLLSYIHDEKPAECQYRFDYVYVFTEEWLISLRIKDSNLMKITIPPEKMNQISEQAFVNATGVSRNEYYGR